MFLIKTRLGSSHIHGIGVFAAEPIKKGQRIWEFIKGFDIHLQREDVMALPEIPKSYILTYSYEHMSLGTYVLAGDNARFLNHSNDPNILDLLFDTKNAAYSLAAKDIAAGEELTVDYRKFDANEDGTFEN